MAHFTKRNHYNPCFWTALWNKSYFDQWRTGTARSGSAREQIVYSLNLRGNVVHLTKVDDVYFEKSLGIAEITPDSMRDFCWRRYPYEYNALSDHITQNPKTLYIDFEDVLTGIESRGIYKSLMQAAKTGALESAEHKGLLACALIIHGMRSYEFMNSMIETSGIMGKQKWEYFWLLKNAWSNRLVLARAVMPLALGQWTLYRTTDHRFPLPDSPVMVNRDTLMAVLSPRLLLEISLTVQRPEDHWISCEDISSSKYREFRRRAINNTFKDVVFDDPVILEEWRHLPEYNKRRAALADPGTRERLLHEASSRIAWATGGFGRVARDFENWIGKYLDVC
jgi:hypothetical protein